MNAANNQYLNAHKELYGRSPYREYEHRKREWLTRNPEATQQQYEEAIRKIVEELRI